jgi:dTDP-4-dehydrorhamnose reductase
LIIRPRQPVSAKASPRNALTKMLTYTKFIDTPNSMTVVEDLGEVTEKLVTKGATGVYNVANAGIMTPYRLALLLKELVKPDLEVTKISKDELNRMTYAKRIDSVLDCSKLAAEGIVLKSAEERLREILPTFKKNIDAADDVLAKTRIETDAKLKLVSKP